MPRLTLAIETSNPTSGPRGPRAGTPAFAGPGVALGNPDLLDAEPLRQTSGHEDDLLPAIDRLFRRAAAAPRDLEAVALSIGPGGYTALRIAAATAKMLAEATGARTIPIPSALAAAWFLDIPRFPALVCLASKGTTAHATLIDTADRPRWPLAARALGPIDAAALAALAPATLIADQFLPAPMLEAARQRGIPLLEPLFTPAAVLALAPHTAPVDPLALAPLYPREPEAVTLWRARKP